jgi:hypothetical protein
MSVDVTNRLPEFKAKIDAGIPVALRLMLDAIDVAAEPVTPMDTGNLRRNKLKQVLGNHGVIAWMQRYAGAQEAGHMTVKTQRPVKLRDGSWITLKPGVHTFKNYSTKGTGPGFAKKAVETVVAGAEPIFRKAGII